MTQPINIKTLETATGILWADWVEFLKPYAQLEHAEMVKIIHAKILEKGVSKSPGWWAQSVTVAYEQHIGRRKPGQSSDGSFNVTISKTVPGDMEMALANWIDRVKNQLEFDGVAIVEPGKVTTTDKWRYWRCELRDGTKLTVTIQTKSNAGQKSMLAITHDKIQSVKQVEQWRKFWKSFTTM